MKKKTKKCLREGCNTPVYGRADKMFCSDKCRNAHHNHEQSILRKQFNATEKWEYDIIPVSFKDYLEYVDCLNDYGNEGWVFGAMIREYKDWPEKGITTHDYICRRRIKFKN